MTLLEKRDKVGGRAYQLVDRGYVFDMGPSLITAPDLLDSILRAAGGRLTDYVDLVPLDPSSARARILGRAYRAYC